MKYQLISPINKQYSITEQILTNRGIKLKDIYHYLNTTSDDINSPLAFNQNILKAAAVALIQTIKSNKRAFILVDADCDGYTSSAIILNYLHDLFPTWVEQNTEYYIHENKEHGLSDCIDYILNNHFDLVIIPDAGSNDTSYCDRLAAADKKIIILDHHIQDMENPSAIIINSQTNYPNENLSGAGVTWQFCRYFDSLLHMNYAENYIDLAALGNCGDMMDLHSIETKEIIREGIENIKNPFFYYMVEKNRYSIGNTVTPTSLSFYVVPFINAIVRSGTQQEKQIVFKSMLKYEAFKEVPSTKRGHNFGEVEKIVEQAIRVATNVKARQTKIQNNMMSLFEKMIQQQQLLNHKVLLFKMEPGQIDRNVAGLCANKIMAKYQRPTCILTKVTDDNGNVSYQGSMRGCDVVGISNFKDICEATGEILYCSGHESAAGLGIAANHIQAFLAKTDAALKDMSSEAIYYVDYIYQNDNINPQDIREIANLSPIYGQGIPQAQIAIEDLKITADMVTVYTKRGNTIKITLPNNINIMMFNATDDAVNQLQTSNSGYVTLDIIGTCSLNEWNGNVTQQILCRDYSIIDSNKYYF